MMVPLAHTKKSVAAWLFVCAGFVLAMVVVGGLTRLTRSGLSIVEWEPIAGILPPLSPEAWQRAFAAYQQSPEGTLVNAGMSLDGFRQIYLVEWVHRLLGRVTGVVVLVPFVFYLVTRRLSGARALRVLGIFALGGLQGFLGWYMVSSGLVDRPHVSHYRLALHLAMALLIFGLLVWSALDERQGSHVGRLRPSAGPSALRPFAWATLIVISVTIVWGGLMAGLHAGHVAPTFPTMNGAWIPEGLASPLDSAVGVHFTHRALGYCAALGTLFTFLLARTRRAPPGARLPSTLLVVLVGVQIALGALTVLHHVPITLAALHQLNGALLLGCAVALVHALRRA